MLENYEVRGFKTTTESLEFMAEFTAIEPILEKIGSEKATIGDFFKAVPPAKLKEIISNYTTKQGEPYDYEIEFKGNFQLVFKLFGKVVQTLMSEASDVGNDKALHSKRDK